MASHTFCVNEEQVLKTCVTPKFIEAIFTQFFSENCFLFNGGHRYVFKGAEVFYDPDDTDEEENDDGEDDEADDDSITESRAATPNTVGNDRLSVSEDSNGIIIHVENRNIKDGTSVADCGSSGSAHITVAGEEDSSYHSPTRLPGVSVSVASDAPGAIVAIHAIGTVASRRPNCVSQLSSCALRSDRTASSESGVCLSSPPHDPAVAGVEHVLSSAEYEESHADWMSLHASLDTHSFSGNSASGAISAASGDDASCGRSERQVSVDDVVTAALATNVEDSFTAPMEGIKSCASVAL